MKTCKRYGWILLISTLLLSAVGCAKNLVFVTKTSVGVDISGTAEIPDKFSVAVSRQELAIVPRMTNGQPHSVFGAMNLDIDSANGLYMNQVFATGVAGKLSAAGQKNDAPYDLKRAETDYDNNYKESYGSSISLKKHPLIFTIDSTTGLDISAGSGDFQPRFLFGYRRSENVFIPIINDGVEADSVYADITVDTKRTTNDSSSTNSPLGLQSNNSNFLKKSRKMSVKQTYATGKAALYIVERPEVRNRIKQVIAENANDIKSIVILIHERLDITSDKDIQILIDKMVQLGILVYTENDYKNKFSIQEKRDHLHSIAKEMYAKSDTEMLKRFLNQLEEINKYQLGG